MESLLPIIVFIIFIALQALASRKPKKTFPDQELPVPSDREMTSEDALRELREVLFGDLTPKPAPPPLPRPAPAHPKPRPKTSIQGSISGAQQGPGAIHGSIPRSAQSPRREPQKRIDLPVEILEKEEQPALHPMLVRLQDPETVRDVVVMSEILQRRRPL